MSNQKDVNGEAQKLRHLANLHPKFAEYFNEAADVIDSLFQRNADLEKELVAHRNHTKLIGELTEYMVKNGLGVVGRTSTKEIVRLYEEMAATVERLRDVENNLLDMLISHFSEDEETWTSKELQSELMEIQRLRNMK